MFEHNGFKFWSWQDYESHRVNAFIEWNCLDLTDEQKLFDIMGIHNDADRREQMVLVWAFPETDEVNDLSEVRNHMEHHSTYSDNLIGVDGMPIGPVYIMQLRRHENKIIALSDDLTPYGFFMSLDTLKILCDWSE